MTHVVQQDFRPSFLRRILRRYQVLELALIIGGILLLWGAVALGRVHTALTQLPIWPS